MKDVAETAFGAHPDDLKNQSKVHDFCLGIPYGKSANFFSIMVFMFMIFIFQLALQSCHGRYDIEMSMQQTLHSNNTWKYHSEQENYESSLLLL